MGSSNFDGFVGSHQAQGLQQTLPFRAGRFKTPSLRCVLREGEIPMSADKPIRRIAIVGTGVIGASWAALFLAHGLEVIATDPAPNAEESLRQYIDTAWPALEQLGLSSGASKERISFTTKLGDALEGVDLVQENGPERPDFKIKLFADMDARTPETTILASSSSGIPIGVSQSQCKHPQRCVIGHPFNPPHLIPLVEVVGGEKTSAATIERSIAFYASIGKRPIHVKKEVVGHVANRLQAALYREIVYLIDQEVLSVTDADAAVSWGPGLRWGVMGPNLLFHLAGGQGGIHHFMEHLAGPMTTWWKDLGNPEFTPDLKEKIVQGVLAEAGNQSIDELAGERDKLLLGLLGLRGTAN
jgi:3-hydroxyacyl-CoA dehydrogenase